MSAASATPSPAAANAAQEPVMIPGEVASAATRVRASGPGPAGATGFPFGHKILSTRRMRGT